MCVGCHTRPTGTLRRGGRAPPWHMSEMPACAALDVITMWPVAGTWSPKLANSLCARCGPALVEHRRPLAQQSALEAAPLAVRGLRSERCDTSSATAWPPPSNSRLSCRSRHCEHSAMQRAFSVFRAVGVVGVMPGANATDGIRSGHAITGLWGEWSRCRRTEVAPTSRPVTSSAVDHPGDHLHVDVDELTSARWSRSTDHSHPAGDPSAPVSGHGSAVKTCDLECG